MSPPDYLTGRLLVAMPGIGDPRFQHAVVFVCAHDAEHAMGLTINQPVEGLSVPTLLKRLKVTSSIKLPDDLVLMGGPVERDRGFVLHTDDYLCERSSVPVIPGINLTASVEVLEAIGDAAARPRRSLLALGYAGWGAGQLEREILDNTWLVCDADENLVFSDDYDRKWTQALAKIGVAPRQLSGHFGTA
ncbi:MAG TPA: YqgE/AlgH family protein [Caulobacteraceae bacterium]|jgi:putative transcriptional regulator